MSNSYNIHDNNIEHLRYCQYLYEANVIFIMNEIIERINTLLKEKGETRKRMCDSVGIGTSTYYTWEKRGNAPDAESIAKIARYLGTTSDYILTGEDSDGGYYADPEVAAMVNELKNNAGMRVLLDASRDLTKEDLFELLDIINKMKRGE